MASKRLILGKTKCLSCGELAPIKQQANELTCSTCPWCGLFVQATAAEADKFLRSRTVALAPGEPVPGEKPPAAAPAAPGGAVPEEELTIFDRLARLGAPTPAAVKVKA